VPQGWNSVLGVELRGEADWFVCLAWLALQLLLQLAAALAAARDGPRRYIAAALMLSSAVVSWTIPGAVIFRFASGMFVVLGVLRVWDMITWPRDDAWLADPKMRSWLIFAVFDIWRWKSRARSFDPRLRKHFAIALSLCLLGHLVAYYGAAAAREPGGEVIYYALRWFFGGVSFVALVDVIDMGSRLGYGRMGVELPSLQSAPVRSRTLDEFWGRRWNAVVCGWFRRHIFAPLARRKRARLGMAASFLASVVIHVWVVAVPTGTRFLLPMGGFFAVHGFFTLVEGPLGVRRWPAARARAWTLTIVVLSSPLFTEPMLHIFDLRPYL
jgi:hypothetical protein